jgi:hypothetical protein
MLSDGPGLCFQNRRAGKGSISPALRTFTAVKSSRHGLDYREQATGSAQGALCSSVARACGVQQPIAVWHAGELVYQRPKFAPHPMSDGSPKITKPPADVR